MAFPALAVRARRVGRRSHENGFADALGCLRLSWTHALEAVQICLADAATARFPALLTIAAESIGARAGLSAGIRAIVPAHGASR